MTTTKKKQMFTPDNSAGTFTPNVSSAIDSVKKTASDIGAGIKETAQKLGEAVPGVTSIGQGLKSYANMNNYKADESTAQEKLDYLDSTSPGKYTESQGLTELRGQLTQVENQKPEEFDNKYQQQIDALLGKMTSQEPFSYDFSTDSNWLAAQEQAKRNALLAMENAMGEAAGLTGGYASSAAQMVGQQVYQQEISETTEMIPEFAQMALNKWQANNSQMASNLAALQSQQDSDYSRYYNDWQLWNQDRAYMYQKVQDMSDDEFNKYLTELQRWQVDRSYYADQKQIAIQNQQWQLELNESRRQFNQQMAFNYINMGVGATVDLTTAGMSAGVQLAGIGVDAALGAADLYEDHRQFDAQMAYNEKWAQNDYDLSLMQFEEEQRQFDAGLDYDYARLNEDARQANQSNALGWANHNENVRQYDLGRADSTYWNDVDYALALEANAEAKRQFDLENGVTTQSTATDGMSTSSFSTLKNQLDGTSNESSRRTTIENMYKSGSINKTQYNELMNRYYE